MKSSKDVPPRVGMQFYAPFDDPSRRITALRGGRIFTDVDPVDCPGMVASQELWDEGSYDITWIPPTDEERRMFMEIADANRDGRHECGPFCFWALGGTGIDWCFRILDQREIADSLALDGADYDNLPAGYR